MLRLCISSGRGLAKKSRPSGNPFAKVRRTKFSARHHQACRPLCGQNDIEPDFLQASHWYRRGAELGDMTCQFALGRLYATGTGLPRNLRQAARWFLRAAEQGHATAAHNIAVFYAEGTGVEQRFGKGQ